MIVCPGHAQVVALPPQYIMPQDGHEKQDWERQAGKRWLAKHAKQIAPHGVPLLGDDLYSNQPFCERALAQGCNFILTCKPDSHATLSERLAFWQATDAIAEHEVGPRDRSVAHVTRLRSINDVLLRRGDGALAVHWFEMTVVHAKTGEQLHHNSWMTNHRLTPAKVLDMAQAGRARWKVENANNNVLKTKGYHIEHHFGHGKHYLSAVMLSLNLLAFLFHTVLEWSDDKYAVLRRVIARRQSFFNDMQALMRYMVFDDWHHLMDFMIRGLELASHFDTS